MSHSGDLDFRSDSSCEECLRNIEHKNKEIADLLVKLNQKDIKLNSLEEDKNIKQKIIMDLATVISRQSSEIQDYIYSVVQKDSKMADFKNQEISFNDKLIQKDVAIINLKNQNRFELNKNNEEIADMRIKNRSLNDKLIQKDAEMADLKNQNRSLKDEVIKKDAVIVDLRIENRSLQQSIQPLKLIDQYLYPTTINLLRSFDIVNNDEP